VDRNDEPSDPFAGLEDWAKGAEKRARKQARRAPKPPRPRYGRARSEPSPLRTALLVILVAVGAVALAASVPHLRSFLPRSSGAAEAYPTQSVPSGITVTTTESAAAVDPFAGTPAANYPKGVAGITMPAATKVAGFTAAQVGADLKKVRAAMIAGRLDQHMLVGHQPDKFLALLAPNNRKQVQPWFRTDRFDNVATEIDPKVRLDPAQLPRVSGRVTYRSLVENDLPTLRVTTNFAWVYAFDGPTHPLAVEHDQINWEFPSTANLRAGDRGMWVADRQSYGALLDCAAAAKGLLAPTPVDAAPGPAPSEDQNNYLRADHSLDIDDNCGLKSKSPAPAVSPS
jgi:hypothetical protein